MFHFFFSLVGRDRWRGGAALRAGISAMSDGDQRSIWDREKDAEEVLAARFEQLITGRCGLCSDVWAWFDDRGSLGFTPVVQICDAGSGSTTVSVGTGCSGIARDGD
jgi:hypothetical protein